jgi:uncharacterized protein YjbI with pentapeptide repeats
MLRHTRRAVLVLAVLLALTSPGPAAAAPPLRLQAREVSARLAQGRAVVASGAVVVGPLALPRVVEAPLVLHNTRFLGPVSGVRTSFSGLVDFSRSTFRAGIDVRGAQFAEPLILERATVRSHARMGLALFEGAADFTSAQFTGVASFAQASFRGASRFADATFAGRADFGETTFDRAADFRSAHFGPVSFRDADFGSIADFASSDYQGNALFREARFSEFADFVGAEFDFADQKKWTSFAKASFDNGATFFRASFAELSFTQSRARASMDFESAQVHGSADFDTIRFTDELSFRRANVERLLNLDQAFVTRLDLERADLSKVLLPGEDGAGRLGGLRLDPGAVHVVVGPERKPNDAAQVRALRLIEATAGESNDLPAENEARIARYELARTQKAGLDLLFDWVVWWGLFGYLVQPVHQLVVIGALVLLGVAVRLVSGHHSIGSDLRGTLQSLFRLGPPDHGWVQLEYLVYKVVTVILLINVGNVWPPFRDLLEGVL